MTHSATKAQSEQHKQTTECKFTLKLLPYSSKGDPILTTTYKGASVSAVPNIIIIIIIRRVCEEFRTFS